jgi:hypothetical protein
MSDRVGLRLRGSVVSWGTTHRGGGGEYQERSVVFHVLYQPYLYGPIPVAEPFKAKVYGLSLAGIAGLSSVGAWMAVCGRCCSLRRADPSSRGGLPTVVCLPECD